MKTNPNFLATITNAEINKLTAQVNETIATDFATQKQFSVIDMWKIQRMKKPVRTRRA